MLTIRYFILSLLLVGSLQTNSWGESGEKTGSWKYLVERTTTKWDKLAKKKEVHIDLALVHYGAGAKQAGGQVKEVPQVVYVDENQKRVPKACYFESPILPLESERFGLYPMLAGVPGSEPNLPIAEHLIPKSSSCLPVRPETELKRGQMWSVTWYLYFGMNTEFTLPATIKHEVIRYERKLGRRCAVIEYTIDSQFRSVDHPEHLTEEERQELRGEFRLEGHGTAYFDTAEEIIVKKEQTISRTSHSERLERLEDGSIGWVPREDRERTVTISVSLIPEGGPKSRLLVYLLIGAGIVIAAVAILRKKASTRSK